MEPELSANEIIARLELRPHPEGGYYRETFRDQRVDAQGRSCSTTIYFLLSRGDRSHWHRIDAAEVWHFYAGSALTLQIAHEGGMQHTVRLGPGAEPAQELLDVVASRLERGSPKEEGRIVSR